MRKVFSIVSGLSLIACAFAYGCGDDDNASTAKPDAGLSSDTGTAADTGTATDSGNTDSGSATLKAKATLTATGLPDSGTPMGTVEFEDNGTQTTVKISVTGATDGDHGLHIHANGDCGNDGGFGVSAGGHWNPTDAGHGFPTGATHHAGDLGNVTATSGAGSSTVTTTTIKLANGDTLNPIGKAVIFHQGSDDGTTQPTGDAGSRAACGIIQAQ